MNTAKFTVSKAKQLHASLVKVAEDMLDAATAPAQPSADGAGTAGPQEVVDALEVVIDELEQVSEAIPAEPTNAAPEEGAPVEAPVEDAPAEPVPEEEEPKLAKQVRELQAQLDSEKKEKLATQFASLFEDSIQQAKYDEIMAGKDSINTLQAKIDTIEQYKQNEGASDSYKPAKTMTSWVKRAKMADSGLMNL
jgi:hypothetical protein